MIPCKDSGKHVWRRNDPQFLMVYEDGNKTVSFDGICKRCGYEGRFIPWSEYKKENDNRENIEVYPHERREQLEKESK